MEYLSLLHDLGSATFEWCATGIYASAANDFEPVFAKLRERVGLRW